MSDCCGCTSWYIFGGVVAFLVIYAKFLRKPFNGYLLTQFAKTLMPFTLPGKKRIFEDGFGKSKRSGKFYNVLEIGVGTGANFQFYPNDCKINILDKNEEFLPFLKTTLANLKRDDLSIGDLIVNPGENMRDVKSESMDVVVATFTLCSVEDPKQVLNEIYRVLKPGGTFIFMDHSKDMTNSFMAFFHHYLGFVWTFIFEDCRFRDIDGLLKNYSKFETKQFGPYARYTGGGVLSIINPLYCGYCQKSN